MVEYGNAVGQAGQVAGSGHAGGGSTDIGASVVASVTGAVDQASAALGVPPGLLAVAGVLVVLFLVWLVFLR